MISSPEQFHRPFLFERDTFAFANELLWEYRLDPVTGTMTTLRHDPAPEYAHRCFVMVRSARQFFYHARFEKDLPVVDTDTYKKLVCEVISRSPRRPSLEEDKVVFSGYDCLRSFSQAQEQLLKAECGGAWESYFLRSHWRMIFPISRSNQEALSEQLLKAFNERFALIVHLVRFPQLTINHGIVLFGFKETDSTILFEAYDPNIPAHSSELIYDRATRTFYYSRNHYWAGGRLDVIEIYRGWFM
jgi:hypothetical protein